MPFLLQKQQEEAKKAAEAQAAAEASEMGLPELTGSEKQVVWATKIRNGLMESISKMQDAAFKIIENAKETGKHQDDLPRVEKAIEFLNACEKVAGTETSAAAFIEWRFDLMSAACWRSARSKTRPSNPGKICSSMADFL